MYLKNIPVIIPAFEPDAELTGVLTCLLEEGLTDIILVDDGSGENYRDIFDEAEKKGCIVLRHAVNLGKGRGLKTAFNYVLDKMPDAVGVVTADSDGQHTPGDIKKCMNALQTAPDRLILGCREFDQENVPWKSRLGNKFTRKICSFLCGIKVSDTQTGLRGIPRDFMKHLMNVQGERFEFEINMLLESIGMVDILEVPIKTVYDSKQSHKTHFDPLRDSFIIYRGILKYSAASILSTVIDFIIFAIAQGLGAEIGFSIAVARVGSSTTNFLLNRNLVFRSKDDKFRQLIQYAALVCFSGVLSALLISYLEKTFFIGAIFGKVIVETCLFFFNYFMQRTFIFVRRRSLKDGEDR